MKTFLYVLVGLLGVFLVWLLLPTPYERNERLRMDSEVFDHIRTSSSWDLNQKMLWGFYFVSHRKAPLQIEAWILKHLHYGMVDISYAEENKIWWLHVERVEVHTLDSLSLRNVRLSRFAKLFFSDYDGWDVGFANTPAR